MDGWIKLHRKVLDNPIVCKDAEHLAVWVYLLLNATHKEREVLFDGKKITLKCGQLITGRKKISEETKVNESKVRRILNDFKNDQQIDQQTSTRNTLISILQWDEYQDNDQQSDQQVTNNRPTSDQQVTTNKNERKKERKNERIDKEKESKKEKADDGKNIPPTLDEIYAWIDKKGYTLDGEQFFDFYESKGWMVGRNKMKNWHSAMSTWDKRERKAKPYKPKEDFADKINNVYRLAEEWAYGEDNETGFYEDSQGNTNLLP